MAIGSTRRFGASPFASLGSQLSVAVGVDFWRALMRYFLILSMLLLFACVETAPQNTTSASADIVVQYDKFKGERIIRTPLYLSRRGFTDTFPVSLAYEAVEKEGKIQSIRLYVEATRTEWGFYGSAIGEDGYKFRFSEVDSVVDSAAGMVLVEEHFSLGVPLAQLNAMSLKNYEIKVYGQRDSGVFVVPSAITKAFLQKINSI